MTVNSFGAPPAALWTVPVSSAGRSENDDRRAGDGLDGWIVNGASSVSWPFTTAERRNQFPGRPEPGKDARER